MCGPEEPPFHASPVVRKGPISSKRVSSQDPLLRKFGNFNLCSLNFHPNLSSQAPKFGKFQLTRPPNLEIFSSQAPKFGNFQFTSAPFRGKYQFASPTLRKSGPHTPTWKKKLSAPPPRGNILFLFGMFYLLECLLSMGYFFGGGDEKCYNELINVIFFTSLLAQA